MTQGDRSAWLDAVGESVIHTSSRLRSKSSVLPPWALIAVVNGPSCEIQNNIVGAVQKNGAVGSYYPWGVPGPLTYR
jgi:hypothetical protein